VIDDNPPSQKHNGWHCCDLQPQGIRSRAFYYSRKSLLHTWITYYTELPMKVPITPHRLENRYYAPPPIAITGNRLTLQKAAHSFCVKSTLVGRALSSAGFDTKLPAEGRVTPAHLHFQPSGRDSGRPDITCSLILGACGNGGQHFALAP